MANSMVEALEKLNEEMPDVDKLQQPETTPVNTEIKTEPEPEPKPGIVSQTIDTKQVPTNQTVPSKDTPPTNPEPAEDDSRFYGRLSKMTDGSLKTESDLVALINHYNELVELSEKGFQPQFKDERTKTVYQLLVENAGKEPEAAMRTLRALSFNPEGKTAKEKLFEAFLLDPRNSDLVNNPTDAQKYFEAEYDASYSDADMNPITQRKLQLAERDAIETIKKVQESFKASEEQPRQISEQVVQSITEAVDSFGGVKLAFSENPQENDFLTMTIDESELSALKNDALNVEQWWNNFVSEFSRPDGSFDYPSFIREFYEMRNHQKKAQLAFQHGQKLGELAYINKVRNASNPKDISRVPQPGGVPSKPGSLAEAWGQAVGVS
jgi:hypothetical protein